MTTAFSLKWLTTTGDHNINRSEDQPNFINHAKLEEMTMTFLRKYGNYRNFQLNLSLSASGSVCCLL